MVEPRSLDSAEDAGIYLSAWLLCWLRQALPSWRLASAAEWVIWAHYEPNEWH